MIHTLFVTLYPPIVAFARQQFSPIMVELLWANRKIKSIENKLNMTRLIKDMHCIVGQTAQTAQIGFN